MRWVLMKAADEPGVGCDGVDDDVHMERFSITHYIGHRRIERIYMEGSIYCAS